MRLASPPSQAGRHVLVILASLAAAIALPRAVAADDAAAILARHTAYVGWQTGSDGTGPSMKTTVRYVRDPQPGDTPPTSAVTPPPFVSTEYRRGLLFRVETTDGRLDYQRGFTGRAFWDRNANENIVYELGHVAQRAYTSNLIDAEAIASFGTVKLLAPETIEGKTVDVVRIAPSVGAPATLAIDRSTGAYVRIVMDPDDKYAKQSVTIDAYKEVTRGKRIVSAYHSSKYGHDTADATYEATIADTDLAVPKYVSHWTFGSGAPAPMEVVTHQSPLGFLGGHGRAVHIHAKINGKDGTFLLDSGAAGEILTHHFADSLNLETIGNAGFRGVNGGGIASQKVRVATIQIGDGVLHDQVVDVAGDGGGDLDGILGYDILATAIVDVDLTNQTIAIMDPEKVGVTAGKGAVIFPVDLTSRQPALETTFENIPLHTVLDSGNDFFLIASDELQRSGKIVATSAKINLGSGLQIDENLYFTGVDGTSQVASRCIRVGSMQVGPYRYATPTTCFGNPAAFQTDGALIGFDFLSHFNWTFDYPEGRLMLTPNGR